MYLQKTNIWKNNFSDRIINDNVSIGEDRIESVLSELEEHNPLLDIRGHWNSINQVEFNQSKQFTCLFAPKNTKEFFTDLKEPEFICQVSDWMKQWRNISDRRKRVITEIR